MMKSFLDEIEERSLDLILMDSRELLRDCIYSLLCNMKNLSVVAQAGEVEECMHLAGSLHPDVVVVGDRPTGDRGGDLFGRLRALRPAPHTVLIGGGQESSEWVRRVVSAGVNGVLLQQDGSGDLVAAIMAAGEGRLYLSPAANVLFAEGAGQRPHASLTRRQHEIFLMYAQGMPTKQIAYSLELSIKTVACHKDQILQRLGLRNTPEIVRYAIREGLLEP